MLFIPVWLISQAAVGLLQLLAQIFWFHPFMKLLPFDELEVLFSAISSDFHLLSMLSLKQGMLLMHPWMKFSIFGPVYCVGLRQRHDGEGPILILDLHLMSLV